MGLAPVLAAFQGVESASYPSQKRCIGDSGDRLTWTCPRKIIGGILTRTVRSVFGRATPALGDAKLLTSLSHENAISKNRSAQNDRCLPCSPGGTRCRPSG